MSFFGKGVVTFIKGLEAYFTVLDWFGERSRYGSLFK
jgi:hypothetical protein